MTIRLKLVLFLLLTLLLSTAVQTSVLSQAARARTNVATGQMKNKNRQGKQARPTNFRDFADCVSWLKRSVYLIARGRPTQVNGKLFVQWATLGSGFLAAPYRLLTASHVIDNPKKENELTRHKAGDTYYLLRTDGDSFHWRSFSPALNKELFLYPDLDVAVIYLDEQFYQVGDAYAPTKDDYLRIDTNFLSIGSSVGVLGYPLAKLEFDGLDVTRPRAGGIFLRAEAGVINTRYKTQQGFSVYEFTMMFNPGNSGGPIFNIKTGKVVSLVEGFRSTPIIEEERMFTDEGTKTLKVYKEKAYISAIHATYSLGKAAASSDIIDILKKHDIIN